MDRIAKRSAATVWSVMLALVLVTVASVSTAQRRDQFRGTWSGTLSPDALFGVPEQHVARLSEPVPIELRVFNRGRVELFFTSKHDEWVFDGRELQLTEIGANGVILGRLRGKDGSQNAFSLNLTRVDEQTLLVNWSKISTRSTLRFDGLDELAFAGTDELELTSTR
jgi:hypothetical protein